MNQQKDQQPPLQIGDMLSDAKVRLDNFPAKGRRLTLKAAPDQLRELAKTVKVREMKVFEAKIHVMAAARGFHVMGTLYALASQPCIVTLEPVEQKIEQEIDRLYLPAGEQEDEPGAGSELFIDLEGNDLPDYFSGNNLDLSGLLLEILALSIDLYPRAPGAELDIDLQGDDPAQFRPFAALKALKTDKDESS